MTLLMIMLVPDNIQMMFTEEVSLIIKEHDNMSISFTQPEYLFVSQND